MRSMPFWANLMMGSLQIAGIASYFLLNWLVLGACLVGIVVMGMYGEGESWEMGWTSG